MTSTAETLAALREANAIQAERILQLEAALAPRQSFDAVGRFSPSEAVILSAILRWEVANFEQILQALYAVRPDDQPDATILRVFVNRIRRKLSAHGIAVYAAYGIGYRMPPDSKARLRQLMDPAP